MLYKQRGRSRRVPSWFVPNQVHANQVLTPARAKGSGQSNQPGADARRTARCSLIATTLWPHARALPNVVRPCCREAAALRTPAMRSVAETVLSQADGSAPLGDTRARKWSDSMRMFVSKSILTLRPKYVSAKRPEGRPAGQATSLATKQVVCTARAHACVRTRKKQEKMYFSLSKTWIC